MDTTNNSEGISEIETDTQETSSGEDFVAIPEATDEELETFIKSDLSLSEDDDDSDEDETEDATPAPAGPDATKPKQEAAPADETPAKDTEALDTAEREKLVQRIKQQEAYIQRRNQEVGELRKQLKTRNEHLEQDLDDKFIENPREAMKAEAEIAKNKDAIDKLEAEQGRLSELHDAQVAVASHLRPDEANLDGMVECLKADGVDPAYIQEFRANPYGVARPETIIQLGKRQKSELLLRQVVGYTKKLLAENQQLKKKSGQVVDKIQSALKEPPQVTARSGGGSNTSKMPAIDSISSWSEEEINAHLQSNT